MLSFLKKHTLATIVSIAFHALIGAALIVGVEFSPRSLGPRIASMPIEAVIVDEGAVQREIDRMEAVEQEELRRQQEAEQRAREEAEAATLERERLAALEREREAAEEREAERQTALRLQHEREEAERVAREQAAEEERQRLAELRRQREEEERRQAEAERQRREEEARIAREKAAEEERRRREAEEAARQQAELERQLADALANEVAEREARESGLYDEYIRSITNRIRQQWIRPPGARADLECVLNVTQIPSGDVTSVSVGQCNGDAAVIRSIETAVLKASPLPQPPVPSLFNRNLIITFRPEN
jgi:colicin import membrane protein